VKVTPHFNLEEVSPLPLAGSGLQVGLRVSNVLVNAGSVWRVNTGVCACGSVCKHKAGVLGILNAFVQDFPGALLAPFCFS